MKTLKVIAGLAVSAFALTNMFGGGSSGERMYRAERAYATGRINRTEFRNRARSLGYQARSRTEIQREYGFGSSR